MIFKIKTKENSKTSNFIMLVAKKPIKLKMRMYKSKKYKPLHFESYNLSSYQKDQHGLEKRTGCINGKSIISVCSRAIRKYCSSIFQLKSTFLINP